MGNCVFEIHVHEDEENYDNPITPTIPKSKLKINNDIKSDEELFIKSIEKSSSLGTYINVSDYKKIVKPNILKYIETHKLNYQEYFNFSSPNIYKANPMQFQNGNVYYGNWNENGEMEGYGIYFIKNKNVITEGIWKKGNNIFGRIFFPNGDIYEGDIKNSLPHGVGTMEMINGERYKGDFIEGNMTGRGTYIFQDKSYYCGEIENGIFKGEGSMKWNNETEYHGNFVNSSLQGKGKMYNNIIGEKYIGNFNKNEFDGIGIYYYKNGDIYEGNFDYGKKEGEGKYKRNDNVEFDLIWNNDLPNGKGFATLKQNKIKGLWRNGNILEIEIIKGNLDNFSEINLNVKPCDRTLCPSSLPHLEIYENDEISQFVIGTSLI